MSAGHSEVSRQLMMNCYASSVSHNMSCGHASLDPEMYVSVLMQFCSRTNNHISQQH